jgi:hypothetical protein
MVAAGSGGVRGHFATVILPMAWPPRPPRRKQASAHLDIAFALDVLFKPRLRII